MIVRNDPRLELDDEVQAYLDETPEPDGLHGHRYMVSAESVGRGLHAVVVVVDGVDVTEDIAAARDRMDAFRRARDAFRRWRNARRAPLAPAPAKPPVTGPARLTLVRRGHGD